MEKNLQNIFFSKIYCNFFILKFHLKIIAQRLFCKFAPNITKYLNSKIVLIESSILSPLKDLDQI